MKAVASVVDTGVKGQERLCLIKSHRLFVVDSRPVPRRRQATCSWAVAVTATLEAHRTQPQLQKRAPARSISIGDPETHPRRTGQASRVKTWLSRSEPCHTKSSSYDTITTCHWDSLPKVRLHLISTITFHRPLPLGYHLEHLELAWPAQSPPLSTSSPVCSGLVWPPLLLHGIASISRPTRAKRSGAPRFTQRQPASHGAICPPPICSCRCRTRLRAWLPCLEVTHSLFMSQAPGFSSNGSFYDVYLSTRCVPQQNSCLVTHPHARETASSLTCIAAFFVGPQSHLPH